MFSVAFNVTGLTPVFDQLATFAEVTAYTATAEVVMSEIRRKTAQGVDSDNTTFHPYTVAYAKWRKRHGHQTERVDLWITGKLMNELYYNLQYKSVMASEETQKIAHGLQVNPKAKYHRNFIGVGLDIYPKIETRLVAELSKV